MRAAVYPIVLPVAGWLSALQALGTGATTLDSGTRVAGIAGVLGTLTVLVYRLGVWRSEMEHTKHDVAKEVKAHREESAANFERLSRRLDAMDHIERRLDALERAFTGKEAS